MFMRGREDRQWRGRKGKETNAAMNDSTVSKYNNFCKAGYLSSNLVTFMSTLLQIKKNIDHIFLHLYKL